MLILAPRADLWTMPQCDLKESAYSTVKCHNQLDGKWFSWRVSAVKLPNVDLKPLFQINLFEIRALNCTQALSLWKLPE